GRGWCNDDLTPLQHGGKMHVYRTGTSVGLQEGTSMGAAAVMAKKKAKPTRAPAPDVEDQVRIRMGREFKAWVQRYSDFRHLSMTDTFIQALIRDARVEGFGEAPPKR